ncbi:MAG: ankyrin repeat domain-containing protein [Endomicrobium sp.]|jgi:ankyrin repeat protein|nr:ankyrin repeat domain-containing protein [Endomicrobium sp.]
MKKIIFLLLIAAMASCGKTKPSDAMLFQAIYDGDAPRVEKLLQQGANPNAAIKDTDNNQEILLHALDAVISNMSLYEAPKEHQEKIMNMLLAAGADPNLETVIGGTSVNFAVGVKGEAGIAVLDKLIKAGADINHRYIKGYNALTDAVMAKNPTMVRHLIKLGLNPNNSNFPPPSNSTLLNYATFFNDKETVKELLAGGADVQAKNSQGKTALMVAKEKGYKDIVNLLQKYKAK